VLEARRTGPETAFPADRAPVALGAVLDPHDAFPANDRSSASTPALPVDGGDLRLAISSAARPGLRGPVDEVAGLRRPGRVALTDESDADVTAAGGSGWVCDAGGAPTCRHPGPLAPGEQLPDLAVSTGGSPGYTQLRALMVDAVPGCPRRRTPVSTRRPAVRS
jgi:hypothetical protein